MAVSITATVARLGGVVGSNISGALLDQHCKIAFYIPGIALIGLYFFHIFFYFSFFGSTKCVLIFMDLFSLYPHTASAFLAFFIPNALNNPAKSKKCAKASA